MSVLTGQVETQALGKPQEGLFSPPAEEEGGKQQGELPCRAGDISGVFKDAENGLAEGQFRAKAWMESEESVNACWLTLRKGVDG